MEVFLIRHGDIDHTDPDHGISELGIRKSTEIGVYLNTVITDTQGVLFLSSPAKRAIQTSQEIQKIIGIPFTISEGIRCAGLGIETRRALLRILDTAHGDGLVYAIIVAHAEQSESLFSTYNPDGDIRYVHRSSGMGTYIHFSYFPNPDNFSQEEK